MLHTYMDAEDPEQLFIVLRRVLTALIHHCKTADQFAPLSDILVQTVEAARKDKPEPLQCLVEILVVVCSVRQGSRLTGKGTPAATNNTDIMAAKHLHALLSQFSTFPLSDQLHAPLLKFVVSCLMAGDMSLWMGLGRKVLERAWEERPTLAMEMTGSLSELNWGGWKLLALPHVTKRVQSVLDVHPQKTLEWLGAIHKDGRLSTVDAAWKQGLQNWVDNRLTVWQGTEEQVSVAI